MTATRNPDEITAFNDALKSVRYAIKRGATEIAKLSYYPTLKRRYVALQSASPTHYVLVKATGLIQDCEAQLFHEVFTFSIDPVPAKYVICWTCNQPLPQWQIDSHYTQCEDCQVRAERQAELDNTIS